jgi:probable addiction module antidote protein
VKRKQEAPSYKEDLLDDLKNRPGYAAKYLTAASSDSDEAFLVALRDVASARTGMSALAAAAKVNRVNLYGMLSEKGNPGIRNIRAIFRALKVKVSFADEPDPASSKPSSARIPQRSKR